VMVGRQYLLFLVASPVLSELEVADDEGCEG